MFVNDDEFVFCCEIFGSWKIAFEHKFFVSQSCEICHFFNPLDSIELESFEIFGERFQRRGMRWEMAHNIS